MKQSGSLEKSKRPWHNSHTAQCQMFLKYWFFYYLFFATLSRNDIRTLELGDKELFGHPKLVPYPYEVNGKLVTGNGSLTPVCSLSNRSLLPCLTAVDCTIKSCRIDCFWTPKLLCGCVGGVGVWGEGGLKPLISPLLLTTALLQSTKVMLLMRF